MARRPSAVVFYALTLKRLTSSVILVGGRSTYDGVCVEERAGGGLDGYTYSCRHDTAADSDVGLQGQEKGRFGEVPTMTCELHKWLLPLSRGGETAEVLNEAVRWPFTSVLREWRMKGKGFQNLKDEREAIAHGFGRQIFLEHGRVFAVVRNCVREGS